MLLFTSMFCKLCYQNLVLILSRSLSTWLPLGSIHPDYLSQDSLERRNGFLKFSLCKDNFFDTLLKPQRGYQHLSLSLYIIHTHTNTHTDTHMSTHTDHIYVWSINADIYVYQSIDKFQHVNRYRYTHM